MIKIPEQFQDDKFAGSGKKAVSTGLAVKENIRCWISLDIRIDYFLILAQVLLF